MDNLKRTPLYEAVVKAGGKLIDFAGWELPVQFEGIIPEHEAVRNAAGLFDVSHMGEVEIKGEDAERYVQNLVTNDVSALNTSQVLYTLMCYPDGGVVDDLLIYKFSEDYFYLVINASNVDKDYEWMKGNRAGCRVEIDNMSEKVSELALQGPNAEKILQKLTAYKLESLKFFYCKRHVNVNEINCMISRTGYTGEDGFEIYTDPQNAEKLWNFIIAAGREYDLKPAGLGCRDTLRFEACLPLYGNEISRDITPLEAGLGFFVKLDKGNFIGRDALIRQKGEGLKRKLVGFEMKERGVPRHGYEVMADGKKIGFVTTGYFSPTLKKNIGLAIIDIGYTELGAEINIMVRNRPLRAEVISKKFYQKKYKK